MAKRRRRNRVLLTKEPTNEQLSMDSASIGSEERPKSTAGVVLKKQDGRAVVDADADATLRGLESDVQLRGNEGSKKHNVDLSKENRTPVLETSKDTATGGSDLSVSDSMRISLRKDNVPAGDSTLYAADDLDAVATGRCIAADEMQIASASIPSSDSLKKLNNMERSQTTQIRLSAPDSDLHARPAKKNGRKWSWTGVGFASMTVMRSSYFAHRLSSNRGARATNTSRRKG